ncbi:hypothetical protein BDY19DRAFT_67609 [Irpex rosettiformis]|uniref:Uncharacterized protein n=1 Tax=Irpex rosettiformis TaxID=378272 RepID=A0ACB8UL67_9APHY|nr:hypothetical protein BDY19DRAFT_67609 [Irpex rosettiformis]
MPHCTSNKQEIPYPFNFNKETMQLWVLDRQVIFAMQGQPSFIDWKGKPPARCLDLGCGLGDWLVDSARLWPNSTFVGFDIANLQIDLNYVEPSVARRIKWVHGNFLERLPFDDNEFDYIHISAIAFCVPEDKWHSVYDEICRILKPNGYVEQGEEDPVFPVLPRWFTTPLHGGEVADVAHEADHATHAHMLLEELFYKVFESRFINITPSSALPGYFSASFKHIISPPIVKIPMPPLAPLPPFDRELIPVTATQRSFPTLPGSFRLQDLSNDVPESPSNDTNKSFSSFGSSSNDMSLSPQSPSETIFSNVERLRNNSVSTANASIRSIGRKSSHTGSSSTGSGSQVAGPAYADHSDSTHVGASKEVYSLWNLEGMAEMDEHSLYVHLTHAAGLVNGVKESMWGELKKMVSHHDHVVQLKRHGWSESDYTESNSRRLFENLWERYQRDLRERIAMWHPMVHYGWTYPKFEVMTETEIAGREKLRREILEARTLAKDEEIQHPIRVTRLLVGMNGKGS